MHARAHGGGERAAAGERVAGVAAGGRELVP